MGRILKPYSGGLVTSKLLVPASTGKIQIDPTHPLAVGLTSAFLPGMTQGYDHVNSFRTLDYFDVEAGLVSTGAVVGTPDGLSMQTTTAGRYMLSNANAITPKSVQAWTGEASFYLRFFQNGSAAGTNAMMFVTDGAQVAMGFGPGSASNINSMYYAGFSSIGPGAALAVNKMHGVLGVYKTGGLTSTLYQDGVSAATSTAVTNPAMTAATTHLVLGSNTDIKITAFYTWRRALNVSEAQMLELDPYGIFQSPATNLWFAASDVIPFGLAKSPDIQEAVYSSWIPPDPQPITSRKLSVQTPAPFPSGLAQSQYAQEVIYSSWIPQAPQPIVPGEKFLPPVSVPEAVPFALAQSPDMQEAVYASWIPQALRAIVPGQPLPPPEPVPPDTFSATPPSNPRMIGWFKLDS